MPGKIIYWCTKKVPRDFHAGGDNAVVIYVDSVRSKNTQLLAKLQAEVFAARLHLWLFAASSCLEHARNIKVSKIY